MNSALCSRLICTWCFMRTSLPPVEVAFPPYGKIVIVGKLQQ